MLESVSVNIPFSTLSAGCHIIIPKHREIFIIYHFCLISQADAYHLKNTMMHKNDCNDMKMTYYALLYYQTSMGFEDHVARLKLFHIFLLLH